MNHYSIGIFDENLVDKAKELENELDGIASKYSLKINCYEVIYIITNPDYQKHNVVFLHRTQYLDDAITFEKQFRYERHLYWVSSEPKFENIDTPSTHQFEVKGINFPLSCPKDYRKLKWEQALMKWGEAIDKWEMDKIGIIPRFPIDELIPKQDLFFILDPLASLNILLQGYLAIREPKIIFGNNHQEFCENHDILQGDTFKQALEKTKYDSRKNQRLFRLKKDSKEKYGWLWFDECLPAINENSFLELAENYEQLKKCDNLKKVWNLLRRECCGEEDGITIKEAVKGFPQDSYQDKLTELFELAHEEYFRLFGEERRKKKALELEKVRSKLNHNEVKNKFLHRLESKNRNGNIEQRAADINLVWANIRGEEIGNIDLKSKIDSIFRALENWNSIFNSLKEFFENVPVKFGYKFTPDGLAVKKEFFRGKDCYTAIINSFVNNFEEIAKKSDRERKERLKAFFNAIDSIYKTLSSMAYEARDDRLFGGYLEPSDKKS